MRGSARRTNKEATTYMLRSSGTSKKGSCMALNRPRQKWRGDRLVIAHISSTPHIAASVVIC